jgi:DNA repair exonuclease SbcCD ATPase subunit
MSEIYLKSLQITNLGPFERHCAEFGPGLNICAGPNHSGKTSQLEAIRLFLDGGMARDLVRMGTTHAEATVLWSDGFKAHKTMDLATNAEEKDSYEITVTGPQGEIKGRAAEAIAQRVPRGSFSASDFLKQDPRKRAEFLLAHLNLSFTAEEFNAALLTPVGKLPNTEIIFSPVTGIVDLAKFDEIRETIYASRTEIKVQIRDLNGAVADLRGTLPQETEKIAVSWSTERDDLQRQLTELEKQISARQSDLRLAAEQRASRKREEISVAQRVLREAISGYVGAATNFAAEVRAFAESDGSKTPQLYSQDLADSCQDFIGAVHKSADKKAELAQFLLDSDTKLAADLMEQTATLKDRAAALSLDLGKARANADREMQAAGTRQAIETRERKAEGLTVREMRRTAVLDALDRLKNERLTELPIEGLSISFDSKKRPVISQNGVPLENLSGMESLFLGFQCVLLGAGECPLIVDEGDGLTEESLEKLSAAIDRATPRPQFILARHSEGTALRVVRYGLGERIGV